MLANNAYADTQKLTIEGQWRFDEDASDSYKKVLRSLEKQLAIQKSFQYPQKENPESKSADGKSRIIDNIPSFLFSSDNLQLQLANNLITLEQGKLLREISLQATSKSFSLKQFTGNTLTAVANITDEHLFIDSTSGSGLFIGEEFYLDKEKRLVQKMRISDGIHKSLYLQRVYVRCSDNCKF